MKRNFVRGFYAVVTGYLIFAISTIVLFKVSSVDPHTQPSTAFIVFSAVYGGLFSLLGGFTAALIAGRKELFHAGVISILLATIAAISYFSSSSSHHWSEILTIFIFSPLCIIGGTIQRLRREKK